MNGRRCGILVLNKDAEDLFDTLEAYRRMMNLDFHAHRTRHEQTSGAGFQLPPNEINLFESEYSGDFDEPVENDMDCMYMTGYSLAAEKGGRRRGGGEGGDEGNAGGGWKGGGAGGAGGGLSPKASSLLSNSVDSFHSFQSHQSGRSNAGKSLLAAMQKSALAGLSTGGSLASDTSSTSKDRLNRTDASRNKFVHDTSSAFKTGGKHKVDSLDHIASMFQLPTAPASSTAPSFNTKNTLEAGGGLSPFNEKPHNGKKPLARGWKTLQRGNSFSRNPLGSKRGRGGTAGGSVSSSLEGGSASASANDSSNYLPLPPGQVVYCSPAGIGDAETKSDINLSSQLRGSRHNPLTMGGGGAREKDKEKETDANTSTGRDRDNEANRDKDRDSELEYPLDSARATYSAPSLSASDHGAHNDDPFYATLDPRGSSSNKPNFTAWNRHLMMVKKLKKNTSTPPPTPKQVMERLGLAKLQERRGLLTTPTLTRSPLCIALSREE